MRICRYDRKIICGNLYETGHGKWSFNEACIKCEVFLKGGHAPLEVFKMGKKNAPQNWITERLEKHNADRRAALKAKGYKELFVFPRGTTEIIVDADKEPRDIPTKNGLRVVFSIKVKGQEKDLMVNPVSALYRGILLSLNNGITKISVTRTGEKKETRYDIA